MTTRKRRRRAAEGLTAYKLAELVTGVMKYPAKGYDGYGDPGISTDASDFISEKMRADWKQYRAEIMQWWASGEWTGGLAFRLTPESAPIRIPPWIFIRGDGSKPWAARNLEKR